MRSPTTLPATLLATLALLSAACASTGAPAGPEALASWNDTQARARIIAFVDQVTDKNHAAWVAPEDRIAVFDNDGTLWCEKPNYIQAEFLIARAKERVRAEPGLAEEEPYRSFLAGTLDPHEDLEGFLKLALDTHTGMSQPEFESLAAEWLTTARHVRYERPYTELVYEPMLELLDYLRAHDFQVWICTGGGQDFVRVIAEDLYGVPPMQVIGTSTQKRFEPTDGKPLLWRVPELVPPVNDKAGKPVNIQHRIGRTPILAVGNSDGDLEMLLASDDGVGTDLQVLVHHDDAEREYDYDKGTERALEVAAERGWVVASIARDFGQVFP